MNLEGVSEGRLEANGLTFRFLEAGPAGGPPVLLLHGFPEGAESWLEQLRWFARQGRRAVAVDMRGYGGSDCPEDEQSYRMHHLVADVAGMAESLGPPVDLAGHDWGALVGWSLVGRHPELVRSWAALSVPHPEPLRQASREDPDQRQRSAYVELFRQPGKAEQVLSADGYARLRRMYRLGPNPEAVPGWVVERYVKGFRRPYRLTAGLNYYRANLAGDGWSQLDSGAEPIRSPTLLIWGDQDPALGRRAVEATAGHMAGPYRLEILEGAGHWLQFERPAQVSALLATHFDSQ